jgi:hypothetical protein
MHTDKHVPSLGFLLFENFHIHHKLLKKTWTHSSKVNDDLLGNCLTHIKRLTFNPITPVVAPGCWSISESLTFPYQLKFMG